jgi:hypothetical protein
MEEFVVGAQHGEVWLLVETTAAVVGCDACGTRVVGHGRQDVRVRDLPGRPLRGAGVAQADRRCSEPACEPTPIAPRTVLTERALSDNGGRVNSWRRLAWVAMVPAR